MGLFINEQPIVINTKMAKIIGLNEAIVLQQIHYWIDINTKTKRNFKNGFYWTYNSYDDWKNNNFDFWSKNTIIRTINKLEKLGFLISGNFNKKGYDRTKWYRINYEKLDDLEKDFDTKKIKKDLETLSQSDLPKMSTWTTQNEQMDLPKMSRPIPENTTEIISDTSSSSTKSKNNTNLKTDDEKKTKNLKLKKDKKNNPLTTTKEDYTELFEKVQSTLVENNISLIKTKINTLLKNKNFSVEKFLVLIEIMKTQSEVKNIIGWLTNGLNNYDEFNDTLSYKGAKQIKKNKFNNYQVPNNKKSHYEMLEEKIKQDRIKKIEELRKSKLEV